MSLKTLLLKQDPLLDFPMARWAHCGPASLRAAAFKLLGKTPSGEEEIAALGGLMTPLLIYWRGFTDAEMVKAIDGLGLRADEQFIEGWSNRKNFIRLLKQHLLEGDSLVMTVDHFGHWIAAIGYDQAIEKFIIKDPALNCLSAWGERYLLSRALNLWQDEELFHAILISK